MKTYEARPRREGRLWVVDVEGVGFTQGRSLSEAKGMAAGLVVALLQVEPGDVEIDVEAELPAALQDQVRLAREARLEVERMQREAAEASRGVVSGLRAAGLSGRDVAVVLGISEQRVSQLRRKPVRAGA